MDMGSIAIGAVLGIAALGSGIGMLFVGMACIGAWKKCFLQNKPAPFSLVVFAGMPLSQTIYGFILMNAMVDAMGRGSALGDWGFLGIGIFGGLAMGFSALAQGRAGAAAADAFAETGKGFVNYVMVLGVIETVALFAMVFLMLVVGA
jgi:V/A-type H+-transporting ATPase subunit K